MTDGRVDYLTPAQAAERLHLTEGTLNQYRVRGSGPDFYRVRVGRNIVVRYPIAAVSEWAFRRAQKKQEMIRRAQRKGKIDESAARESKTSLNTKRFMKLHAEAEINADRHLAALRAEREAMKAATKQAMRSEKS